MPREVSAYLTVFPKQASPIQEGLSPGCPMQCRWKCTFGSMPRFFRKTYCLPLSPRRCGEPFISLVVQLQSAASEHRDVRLRYAAYLSPFSSTRPQAPRSSPLKWPAPVSLIRSARNTARHSREIWTQNNHSHIAMSYQPSFAWKASLRAHRRRFARPPLVL